MEKLQLLNTYLSFKNASQHASLLSRQHKAETIVRAYGDKWGVFVLESEFCLFTGWQIPHWTEKPEGLEPDPRWSEFERIRDF